MLFHYFTLHSLFAVLFSLSLRASAGPCMPCHPSNRRYTPWDERQLPSRGVYTPNITNPTDHTIWIGGSDVVVTWDPSDISSSPKGTLLLGYKPKGSDDEHLDLKHPLAEVELKKGFVTFKCPEVVEREDYIIVFGESGNRSPPFTIKK